MQTELDNSNEILHKKWENSYNIHIVPSFYEIVDTEKGIEPKTSEIYRHK